MAEILTNAAEFTVSEIAQAVKRQIEDSFGFVRVRGEISGFRGQHSSGHAYFTLKDESAAIDAVIWKGSWARLAFKPQEGLEVIATGRLTTFPRSSKYQIVIDQIEPAGAGALMALLDDRRKKLAAEGLFARERKRPLPYLPRVIGVVTSPTGAVIRDILHRLEDRFPSHVLVWPVRVQGDTCAAEVSAAVAGFNALPEGGPIPRPDLLIVARGGGSIEDLWGFNEEIVVRAVAASQIPVISGVGHETDTTLVDHAADMRAPTPTAAAEAAVPVRSELIGYVDDLGMRQRNAARRSLANDRDRLRAAGTGLPRPGDLLNTPRQRLDLAASTLVSALRHMSQKKALGLSRVGPRLAPQVLRQRTSRAADRLANAGRRSLTAINRAVAHAQLVCRPVGERLSPAIRRVLGDRQRGFEQSARLLGTVGYRNILARGFALVVDAEGRLVRSSQGHPAGELLGIEFSDGRLGVTVGDGPGPSRRPDIAPTRQRRGRSAGPDEDDQPDLF